VTGDAGESASLRSVGRSALLLTASTAVVQALGVARELFVAAQVGVSSRLDALLIALILPTALASLLTSGMVTALVPAYLNALRSRGRDEARRLSGAVLSWVGLGGAVLSAALAFLAGISIAVAGPGLSPVDRASAITYLQLLAPIAVVSSVSGILYAICQAEERFRAIALATLVGPAVTLAVVVFGWQDLDLMALAIGSLVGPMTTTVLLFGATAHAASLPRPGLRTEGLEFRPLLAHAGPLTVGAAILQINVIVDRAVASLLAPGAVSALRYAEVLIKTPISAISPAWSAAVYPTLVHMAQGEDRTRLGSVTMRMVRFAIATFVPIAILTVAVAPIAVGVAFGRGAFSAQDLALTTTVAVGFAPLLVVLMTSPVIRLALNARQLGRVLLYGAALNVVLNTIFDVLFGITLGVAGVALSSALTAGAVGVFFARRLEGVDPAFRFGEIARVALLSALATIPVVLPIAAVSWSGQVRPDTVVGLVLLVAFGAIGMGSYVVVATRLGLEEPRQLLTIGLSWLKRRLGSSREAP
jgi:putative peptidoglycan lipid II flippase